LLIIQTDVAPDSGNGILRQNAIPQRIVIDDGKPNDKFGV